MIIQLGEVSWVGGRVVTTTTHPLPLTPVSIHCMASEKTRAIVLRLVEFSETSCVVTLFTEDFGKVGALAKGRGGRRAPSRALLTCSRSFA